MIGKWVYAYQISKDIIENKFLVISLPKSIFTPGAWGKDWPLNPLPQSIDLRVLNSFMQ